MDAPNPASHTLHAHFVETDLTLSLLLSHYAWGGVGAGVGSRVFGDSSGERTNSFVELLRSERSLRGAKTQKHGEGTGGLDENLKHLSLA